MYKLEKFVRFNKKKFKKLLSKKIDNYIPSIILISNYQRKKFEKRCLEKKIHDSYEIDLNYKYLYDQNKNPYIIYLTKKQAKDNEIAMKNKEKYTIKMSGYHFKKICREVLIDNNKFLHLLKEQFAEEVDMGLYEFPTTHPIQNYKSRIKPLSKDVELYEKPTKRTITIGKKMPKDFIKKFVKKDKIENYYPSVVYLDIYSLIRYLKRIKRTLKAKKKFGRSRLIKNKSKFYFPMSKDKFSNAKAFVLYLTKSQIKDLIIDRKNGNLDMTKIYFSNNQILKTYKEVIRINSEIYRYLKYRKVDRFYKDNKPNTSPSPKLLALSDKPYTPSELLTLTEDLEKDLIDFGEDEKDLIDFGEDEKDLIDFDTIIPPPLKKPTAQELLNDKELFPKGKKYKVLQDEDLIPTSTTPSTSGVNILKNILNSPETKRILGVSLTSDLKEKIKNLDSEAAFGLANILSSLISANRGKMSVYSVSRNQLKEIIEGFITTLSVLLNPTQKY